MSTFQGSLPLLTRPEHIVYFFRDVHGIAPITKEVLIQRTTEYKAWVEAFARDHGVPIEWAEAGVKKEDHVRPYLERFTRRRRVGVYFIFCSMERGPKVKFHVLPPKAADPLYRLIRRMRGRYTHFYFYIRDDVLGPFVMCVGSFCTGPLSRSRRPTTSMGTISLRASWSARACASAGITIPSWRPPIPPRCKRRRIA